MASIPIQALAALRMGVGTACFVAPSFTCSTLFYNLPAHSLLAVRLFGGRDALLGALLWTAKTPEARRRAMLAGIAVDVLDVAACAWGYLTGDHDAKPAVAFSGGAVSFLILASLGWKGVGLGRALKAA